MSSARFHDPPPDPAKAPPYEVQFYVTDSGFAPAEDFIEGLEEPKKGILIAAIEKVLVYQGKDVVQTPFGKPLREGLFEFRVRAENKVALRLYFHPHGKKLILLLAGFDKGRYGDDRREQQAIKAARKNLSDWRRTNH